MDVGARLRQTRESRGLTREAVVRATRIPLAALAAIEDNDIARLPPHPYNKGFVEAYAREVGLEPHATAREFLDQFDFVPAPPPIVADRVPAEMLIEGRPRRFAWLTIPIVFLAWWFFLSGRGAPPASQSATQTAPPLAEPVPVVAKDEPASPRDVAPAGGAAAHAGAISLVLTTRDDAWVEARADGLRVLYELLEGGVERRLSADREISMRVGDAGAVSIVLNGRPLGALGSPGQVREIYVTPDGLR